MPIALSDADLRAFARQIIPAPSDLEAMMIGEAAFGLSRLIPVLDAARAHRVIEIGAGPLILSTYLACRGLDVTAVEPLGGEFDSFSDLQQRMQRAARRDGARLTVLPIGVDQVDVSGAFDVAFSVNALEHMPDPHQALDIMYRAVRPGGIVCVHCPNYDVPFDSHFGIVLIGLGKPLNERVYGSRINGRRALWDGLTFTRLSALRRHCARRGYAVTFNRGMLRSAVLRLRDDSVFSARMPRPLRAIGRLLTSRWVADALTLVPVRFQTPMEFVVRKP